MSNDKFAVQRQEVFSSEGENRARLAPFTGYRVLSAGGAFVVVADQKAMLVKRLIACNTTGSAATLSLHAVPDGGSAGEDNKELSDFSVNGDTTVDLTDLVGGYYGPGTTLQVVGGTNNALTLSGYFEDVF